MEGAGTLFVVCGEPSGETYAAGAVRAFRQIAPRAAVEGIGGERLAASGARLLFDYQAISVVGVFEVATRLPAILRALGMAIARARAGDVGAVLLVDFPDFNFRVGKNAAAAGVPVVYFIPPQLWAWRRGRARELAAFARGAVVPFPFEVPFLAEAGVDAVFAGHPLLWELAPWLEEARRPRETCGGPVVGLLPGSREGEIASHLPLMVRAAGELSRRISGISFVVPLADRRFRPIVERGLQGASLCATIVDEARHRAFVEMDTALCASGTATLELALLGVPPVIVYRTSWPTYWIGRRLARVRNIGLPNIVAREPFLPELVQEECTAERMADEVFRLLADPARREALRARCLSLRDALEGEGPYEAVARMLAREWRGEWA